MAVLVTGGTGYIGSHTVVELLQANEDVIVIDNFSNSKPGVINAIQDITGKGFGFYEGDAADKELLRRIFRENFIEEVIHFAGYKAVGESCNKPVMYYRNNIDTTLSLLEVMEEFGCRRFVFSSSATVYGIPDKVPVTESSPLSAINPYGSTKLMIENMCRELCAADERWSIALLRYFNPIGAHESGRIGDDPNGIPNNLMPIILKVVSGQMPNLSVFGNDYPTPDGTCIRDYIHVVDLAKGHLAAIAAVRSEHGAMAYNLGTGKGYSVLEIINAFEKVNNVKVPYVIAGRRAGDAAKCYSDPSKANRELKWKAEKGIEAMCRDAWGFIEKNK
ncbi:MAG: UDP-glucose 4-epimerase GalE [Firmicutes bacterium]|nr:UDP-glucose 4-epimerase GalE [[Eubacterium] siraeum]MCM1489178.1 UDP-glucose 4-epimerase GalE [Bacillota bacterium]